MKSRSGRESLIVGPGDDPRTVLGPSQEILRVPDNWEFLPPGDAGLTRRVKNSGPTWTVQVKKGRKVFSQGLWADSSRIQEKRRELEVERSTEAYTKRQAASVARREKIQDSYVQEFERAVVEFLNFAPCYEEIALQLAKQVTQHATPVGSGTVARTQRIPIQRRAEAAVIAWMRHQTTAYDSMKIARIRGERREVRRMLAERSRQLLGDYRSGHPVSPLKCPLQCALRQFTKE